MVTYCILITYVLYNDSTYKEDWFVYNFVDVFILPEKIRKLHSAIVQPYELYLVSVRNAIQFK